MRSYPVAFVRPGDDLVPHPINAELAECTRTLHALDGWNLVAASVLVAKTALGAWGKVQTFGYEDMMAVTVQAGSSNNDVYWIPATDPAAPWIQRITTGDCMLEVAFGATILMNPTTAIAGLWIGCKVDGVFVVRSGVVNQGGRVNDHCDMVGQIALAAGEHLIEPVFGVHPSGTASTLGVSTEVDFYDRVITLRELAR